MKKAFVLALTSYIYTVLLNDVTVRCVGGNYYSSSKEGYLYNVGYGGFMANGNIEHGVTFVKVTKDPHKALKLKQESIYYDNTPYTIFIAEGVKVKAKGRGPFPDAAGLNIYGGVNYSRVSIEDRMDLISHRIAISTPTDPYSEAVLMRIFGKCMMADSQGNVNINECIPRAKEGHHNQEWIWIDHDRYDEDMSRGIPLTYTGMMPPPPPANPDCKKTSTQNSSDIHKNCPESNPPAVTHPQ
ncbi:hypothetical protein NEOKW01_1363 [Nematocida sp. AWRm80]|nr:hypothetical protein NEOKW01_1363 [Nematocida sp. AWRm80]